MDTAEDYAGGDSEKQLRVALSGLSAEQREKCCDRLENSTKSLQ